MEVLDDRELMGRAGADPSAFAELVARHQDAIRGFTALWAPSRDEADDIAQEVFLAALHSARTYDASRDLKSWLLGIARNLTRQAWRRVARLPQNADDAMASRLEQHALAVFQELQKNADQRRAALDKCVHGLPQEDHELFRHYVVEEQSSATLASHLSTTEGTVRARISRIRRRLRSCIERRLQMGAVS